MSEHTQETVNGYAEQVVNDVFAAVNDADTEITNSEDLKTLIVETSELYAEKHGSECVGDVINAVSKDEDIIALKEKMGQEQRLAM